MIRGTSSGADDVIGNGKCVLSGHLREAIWMIASNKALKNMFPVFLLAGPHLPDDALFTLILFLHGVVRLTRQRRLQLAEGLW